MADAIVGTCQTPGCGKPATLQCPKCKELRLPASFFCSQACFKGFWSIHKMMHECMFKWSRWFEESGPVGGGMEMYSRRMREEGKFINNIIQPTIRLLTNLKITNLLAH